MVGHYLLIALRNFQRNPLSTGIKLLALALGFVCLLTAHAIGDYFRNADTQWEKTGRIYTLIQTNFIGGREFPSIVPGAASVAADYLRTDFPELEAVARLGLGAQPLVRVGDRTGRWNVVPVDPDFLRIFDLPMVAGGGEATLEAPRAAIIAKRVADALFGEENPLGQTIDMGGVDLVVAGVMDDLSRPSHLASGIRRLEILTNFATMEEFQRAQGFFSGDDGTEDWRNAGVATYVLLPEDRTLTAAAFNRRLTDFASRRVSDPTLMAVFRARPVSDLFEMEFDRLTLGNSLGLSITTILYLFGGLTLAVACVDFAGLASAEAARRAREIGLRKTLGAGRGQVTMQMLMETGLLCAAALLLVMPLTALVLRALETYAYLDVPFPSLARADYWLGVIGIASIVALAAGSYPALILARIRPAFALRFAALRGGGAIRSLLIMLQFAAASFLLVIITVMLLQTAALRRDAIRPGADVLVDLRLNASQLASAETLRTELLAHPAITGFTVGNSSPYSRQSGGGFSITRSANPGGAASVPVNFRAYSYGYLDLVGATFLAGRDFSSDLDPLPSSEDSVRAVVIDADTARLLGFGSPGEAIGQTLYSVQTAPGARSTDMTVIGVVERPPLQIFSDGPRNFIYGLVPQGYARAPLVRIAHDRVDEGVAHIENTWRRLFPGEDIERLFLDELFTGSFFMFSMLNAAFMALSAIAIAIAAMGLFGMASFVVQRRVREIGVRKTLGASSARVLGLMLWDFSRPVILANVIAWPFAWIAARAYLDLFVTRIDLTPLPFLAALAASLLVAWIAVGAHALGAARVKPALVLRAE